jgi:hypothetical protein
MENGFLIDKWSDIYPEDIIICNKNLVHEELL